MSGQNSDDTLIGKAALGAYKPYPTDKDAAEYKALGGLYDQGGDIALVDPSKHNGKSRVEKYYHGKFPSDIDKMRTILSDPIDKANTEKVDARLAESILKAKLATRRSAVASLGAKFGNFAHLDSVNYETTTEDGKKRYTNGMSTRGEEFTGGTTRAFAAYPGDSLAKYKGTKAYTSLESVKVHEAVHLGIYEVARSIAKERGEKFNSTANAAEYVTGLPNISEEKLTRWIMANKMGAPEKDIPPDQLVSKEEFGKYQEAYNIMEKQAAKQMFRNKPSGAR